MAQAINILKREKQEAIIVLLLVSLIIGTFLRISLLVIYPVVAAGLVAFYRLRTSSALIILMLIIGTSLIFSLYPHPFLKYKLVSLFYMLPFVVLLFANPATRYNGVDHFRLFIGALTAVAVMNDVVGFIQFFNNPHSDDSFTGIYTQYSLSLNGLMLLNAALFYYYFLRFLYLRKRVSLLASLFFLASSVLCFYGAGLIVCLAAFILSLFRITIKSLITTFLAAVVSISTVYYAMKIIKPQTLEYNIANIKNLLSLDLKYGPRKILSFYNYYHSYPHNAKDFLLGSGPGTFNSRSAFMVGSPSYFSGIQFIKDQQQPYYFKNYAYTLWNENNTIKELYLDGFRNQPFSSILAFLGEYGLIFTIAFFILYYRLYRTTALQYLKNGSNATAKILFRYFKFLIILLPLLLLIDNFLEYPEVILLIVLSMKLVQIDLFTKYQTPTANVT